MFPYKLGNEAISRVNVIRDLGVLIDSHINFKPHVVSLHKTGFKLLRVISHLTRNFKFPDTVIRLFCSLVKSRLEFGSIAWNQLPKTYSHLIESVQKRLVRIIYDRYFERKVYYEYNSLLNIIGINNLDSRQCCCDVMFFYKVLNGHLDAPDLLHSVNLHVPQRFTRHCTLFAPSMFRSESPSERLQVLGNSISTEIDFSMPPSAFYCDLINLCV